MTKDDLVELLTLAEDMEIASPENGRLLRRIVLRMSELETMLAYLRDRPGECLGDNPKWMTKIEALVGSQQETD